MTKSEQMSRPQIVNNREVYIDALRILAILLVVFNHLPGYTLYQTCVGFKALLYMLITMVTRVNVPLFLMVSGALLLGRNEPTLRLLKYRVLRIIAAIVVFGTLCYLIKTDRPTLGALAKGLLGGNIEGSYWFLYAYLGMLLLLPFLRLVAARLDTDKFIYLLVLHATVSTVIPILVYVVAVVTGEIISINLSLPLASTKQLFYPLVGYYLGHVLKLEKLSWKWISYLCVAALAGALISCGFTYYQGITTGYSQDFVQLFDWVGAIAVFVLIRYIFENIGASKVEKLALANKLIVFLGPLTFGVYLLDPLLKYNLYGGVTAALEPFMPTLFVSLAWCLVSFTLGSMLAFLLRRLPLFRMIL